jgi:hypothetical protein
VSNTVTNFSNQINVNFPVAGEDNDSQGFRSNFSRIQNSLISAGQQLDSLQINSVRLDSPQNDFNGNVIKRASFQSCSEYVNDRSGEPTTSTFTVNYDQGTYQQFSINSGTTYFTISHWPDSGLGSIKLEITPSTGSTSTVDFIYGTTRYVSTSSSLLPASYNQFEVPVVWELWTTDSGSTIFAKETNYKLNV